MLKLDRRTTIVGAALGGGALLAGMAWWWWLPAIARDRAIEAGERLTGMNVAIEGVSMRLRGVVLEGVTAEGRHGGFLVRAEEVGVRTGLFGIGGASSVDAIQVRDVRVRADLADDGFAESIEAVREARSRGGAAGGVEGDRTLELEARAITVEVDDAHGPLLRVRGGTARRAQGQWELSAEAAQIGTDPGDVLRLTSPSLRAARDEAGRLSIHGAELEGGELVWAHRGEESGAERPEITGIHRLQAARDALLGPPVEGADGGDEPDSGLLSTLAPDAAVRVRDFDVGARTDEGQETILSNLELTFTRDAQGVVEAQGEGTPGQAGSLRWDLRYWPGELRGEGTIGFDELPLALVAPMLPAVPWYEAERARLDGDIVIRGASSDRIGVSGHVVLRGAAMHSSRIGPEPIRDIDVRVSGEGEWNPLRRRLELESAEIAMGGAAVRLGGLLEWRPDGYAIDLTATLPPTPCSAAVGSIPGDLLADVAGFSFRGTMGGRLRLRLDSHALDDTELELSVSEACEFETVPVMADLTRVTLPFLHRVHEPDGSWFEMTTGPGTESWTSIRSMSPFFVHAVLAHEDASFFRHHGFAPWAIRDALVRNLREGRFVYGASTITMQLAKNLFLHREKYIARKVQEVLLTWWLEKALDKAAILELYLNVIEYGPGVYGIRNGARHYFGRDPSQLSAAEGAFLASVLPSPKSYQWQWERGEPSDSMRNRIRRLLTHMAARGRIDQTALDEALSETAQLRFHREGAPPPAPHVTAGTARPLPLSSFGQGDFGDEWDRWDALDGWVDEDVAEPAPAPNGG
jgi:hypothetical protein